MLHVYDVWTWCGEERKKIYVLKYMVYSSREKKNSQLVQKYVEIFFFLSFESFPLPVFLVFSCSLCLHLSVSHLSHFGGDKDPIHRYWNKWPSALLSTGSTQLNLLLGCPCVFFLANKLICSNFVMSPSASAS